MPCFVYLLLFLGTSISWGTWQRTPVQTTRSFSSFQVRGTAVSQFDKHSLILLALCDKNVDGFSLSRFFYYLFIVRICIKLRNHAHPKSHLLCLSNLLSTLVCHLQSNLKRDHSMCLWWWGALRRWALRRIPWPVEEGANAEIVSYDAKSNLHLKGKKFLSWQPKRLPPLSLLGWQRTILGPCCSAHALLLSPGGFARRGWKYGKA